MNTAGYCELCTTCNCESGYFYNWDNNICTVCDTKCVECYVSST